MYVSSTRLHTVTYIGIWKGRSPFFRLAKKIVLIRTYGLYAKRTLGIRCRDRGATSRFHVGEGGGARVPRPLSPPSAVPALNTRELRQMSDTHRSSTLVAIRR